MKALVQLDNVSVIFDVYVCASGSLVWLSVIASSLTLRPYTRLTIQVYKVGVQEIKVPPLEQGEILVKVDYVAIVSLPISHRSKMLTMFSSLPISISSHLPITHCLSSPA